MISRVWRGVTKKEAADCYVQYVKENVFPELANTKGLIEARVLRHDLKYYVEFLVITQWESFDAIKGFVGDDIKQAVVSPVAHKLLSDYEGTVKHYIVVLDNIKDKD